MRNKHFDYVDCYCSGEIVVEEQHFIVYTLIDEKEKRAIKKSLGCYDDETMIPFGSI